MATLIELDSKLPDVTPITRVKTSTVHHYKPQAIGNPPKPPTKGQAELNKLSSIYQECASYANKQRCYDESTRDYRMAATLHAAARTNDPRGHLEAYLEELTYLYDEVVDAIATYDEAEEKQD